VNPERQSWKCWVCDIGGDIFSWTMRAEGLEFREALEMLAERAGVSLAPRDHERERREVSAGVCAKRMGLAPQTRPSRRHF
jgi:DNA primase